MKRIDRETVQKILDAADIVEVVSDFVRLKKRGANYIGLCPFHAERTPSFSVSKSRGICKCFSCGKGGGPVNFLIEHEGFSYNEALRYLAKKYNIEVREYAVSEEEQKEEAERESMFALNEWVSNTYNSNLYNTADGRDIGLSYFRERGLNDSIIAKYKLGFSLNRNSIVAEAEKAGFSPKYLLDTGLCYKRESTGELIDRFYERVIFPIFSVSGRVVGFGGRTLKKSKEVAKYVNSPESVIYVKNKELYGLFQAKKSIEKKGYCLLVEGYMDVLSMAQAGIDNIVASSGTSLTEGQIRLIHRFADKVVLMYDSDAAGIKAAIRGVDLLLAEGLDIQIVLLPEGDDPDSFAQSHSSDEVETYIRENAEDFIKFKTRILADDAANDPVSRSHIINDIVNSISVIPEEIKRIVYCQECSRLLNIQEDVLMRQVAKVRARASEKRFARQQLSNARQSVNSFEEVKRISEATEAQSTQKQSKYSDRDQNKIYRCEEEIIKYIARYAFLYLCDCVDETGNSFPMNVLEFIDVDLNNEDMSFQKDVHKRFYNLAVSLIPQWDRESEIEKRKLQDLRQHLIEDGIEKIRQEAIDINDINKRERLLNDQIGKQIDDLWLTFSSQYLGNQILMSEDKEIRELTLKLMTDKHQLSRYHNKYVQLPNEVELLQGHIAQALNAWKYTIVESKINRLINDISDAAANGDSDKVMSLMKKKLDLDRQKAEFAKILGDRVLSP